MSIWNCFDAGDEGGAVRFAYDASNRVTHKGKTVPGVAEMDAAWSIQNYALTGGNMTAVKVPAGIVPGIYSAILANRPSMEYVK